MMQIFKKFYLLVLILLISCIKEIDISEFSEDFINYEPELRIEALILPTENTAIVRIDKSVLINDLTLYNCKDDDYGIISQDDCNSLGGTWHGEEEDSVADCGDWVAGKFVCWACSGNDHIQKDIIDTSFINNISWFLTI